ncbi:hypothetical protein MKX03_011528, partial [Papaver bracteatum]
STTGASVATNIYFSHFPLATLLSDVLIYPSKKFVCLPKYIKWFSLTLHSEKGIRNSL